MPRSVCGIVTTGLAEQGKYPPSKKPAEVAGPTLTNLNPMKQPSTKRMGLAVLAGGLAFVGSAQATELVVDGSFEDTQPSNLAVVRVGGTASPGVGQGWTYYSTYLYSTQYTLPGPPGSGLAYLRPYKSGVYGITQSSDTVSQEVSLTTTTTLTPAKIDSGSASFTASAWFSSYLTQGDYSDLTVTFLDGSGQAVGSPVALGGETFIANIPTGPNSKYSDAKEWDQDSQSGTIPAGARFAKILIHSTPLAGAPDGYVDLVSLDVVDNALRTPAVAAADPGNNVIGVNPPVEITVTLEDRITAVDTNSVKLFLDGALVAASLSKPGTNTYVTFDAGVLPPLSQHTYSIVFGDNGSPVTIQTNTFQFTMARYLSLPAGLATPLGSEQANQPGFAMRVYQVDSLSSQDPAPNQVDLPNSISFDEAILAGLVEPNVADLSQAASSNLFNIPTVIAFVNSVTTGPNFPNTDTEFPGLPSVDAAVEDDFVDEIRTYVRFPAAGYYQMGVNNSDAFKLTAATSGVQRLQVKIGQTNVVIPSVAIGTNISQLQFGGALPLTPLTAQVVYATPSGNPDDACSIANLTTLAGKIVLLDRGGSGCDSSTKAQQAQMAGAVAVIETTPGDTGFPFRLGDINANVTIPVLVISDAFGGSSLKAALAAGTNVTASIQGDPNPVLAEWDGPKAFGAVDVLFGFAVPAPGLYPLRLVADHATKSADLEWFSVLSDGTRVLVNDTTSTNALLAFRAVVAPPHLDAPILSNGILALSWTGSGVLQEATSVTGPFTASSSQANPQMVPVSGPVKFYRVLQP